MRTIVEPLSSTEVDPRDRGTGEMYSSKDVDNYGILNIASTRENHSRRRGPQKLTDKIRSTRSLIHEMFSVSP